MWASATSTAGVGEGSLLEPWQVFVYFVVAPLVLLLVVGALAWGRPARRPVTQQPVLRRPAPDVGPEQERPPG